MIKCSSDITGYYFDECLYEPGIPAAHIKDVLIANGYKVGEVVYCDHMLTKINALRLPAGPFRIFVVSSRESGIISLISSELWI